MDLSFFQNDVKNDGPRELIMDAPYFIIKVEARFEDNTQNVKQPDILDESNTKVVLYLDSNVNSIHYWEKNYIQHGNHFVIDLCGVSFKNHKNTDHKCQNSKKIKQNNLPMSTRICAQIFKKMKNEFGNMCWLNFGVSNCLLYDFLLHQKRGGDWYKMILKMHTSNIDSTGCISIKLLKEKNKNNTNMCKSNINVNERMGDIITNTKGNSKFTENSVFINKSNIRKDMNFFSDTTSMHYKSNNLLTLNNNINQSANAPNMIETFDDMFEYLDIEGDIFESYNTSTSPFMINSSPLSSSPNSSNIIWNNIKSKSDSPETILFEKKVLDEYIEMCSNENDIYPDWISGSENIQCPCYPSQITVSDTRLLLPYPAYVIYEPPYIKKKFWKDALIIMTSRRGYSNIDDYMNLFSFHSMLDALVEEPPTDEKELNRLTAQIQTIAIQAVDMICQLAHTMEYIADQVIDPCTKTSKKIEIFGDALFTFCGDCDDLASTVFQMFDDFVLRQQFNITLQHSLDKDDNEDDEDFIKMKSLELKFERVLFIMQLILKRYIPFMCIEGVSCASAQNQHELQEKPAEISGAHAAIKILPIHYVTQCLREWNPNHVISKLNRIDFEIDNINHKTGGPFNYLPKLVKIMIKSDKNNNNSDKNMRINEGWDKYLQILLGEGTGMLNSGGEVDPCKDISLRKYVYSCEATKCAKKPLYPPKGTSPFYKAILFGSTNRFIRDFNIGTFKFCKKQKQNAFNCSNEFSFNRGIYFNDLVNMTTELALVPYGGSSNSNSNGNNIDKVPNFLKTDSQCEFNDILMHIMKETLKVRIKQKPVHPYEKKGYKSVVILMENFMDVKNNVITLKNLPSDIITWLSKESVGFLNLEKIKRILYKNYVDLFSRGKSCGLHGNKTNNNVIKSLFTDKYGIIEQKKFMENITLYNKAISYENQIDINTVSIYYDDFYLNSETCENLLDHLGGRGLLLNFHLEQHSKNTKMWRVNIMEISC